MTPEQIQTRINQIDSEIQNLYKKLQEKDRAWDFSKSFDEYECMRQPEASMVDKLSTEKRMIMPFELKDIPDYGDVMTLTDFIANVKCGGFIDYDGSGNYIKDGKMTNISIYPSDIKKNAVRREFDTIIWFNR